MHVLFLMADGFEETEMITPFDYLQRAGATVALASITERLDVEGGHGLKIKADLCLKDAKLDEYDAVLLPGGGVGVRNLSASSLVADVVRAFDSAKKWVLAICAAPLVLSKAGVLANRMATCFPGCEVDLICKEFSEDRVVVDGNVVTSRGAGTAEEFALECIVQLIGIEHAEHIRKQVVAR